MNNEGKKVLFIINKYSGTGYQSKLEGKMIKICHQHDVECTLEFTERRGHATALAREGVEANFDWVVASGGDGTLNEVAQGLMHTHVPMGIIPRGSGNGLARHLGIPLTIEASTNALFDSTPTLIDTFTLNGKLSLNVSGIGFDGHIANQFDKASKRGFTSYAKITIEEYQRFKPFEIEVSLPGQTLHRRAFVVAVANSSQYGNNAKIAPSASVRDQLMHITLATKVPPYRVDFAYALFTGTVDQSTFCETFTAAQFSAKVKEPMAYHIDGEPCGQATEFDFVLLPLSLNVLVPNHSLHCL